MKNEIIDIWDWPKTSLGEKLASMESSMLCPICSELYVNPQCFSMCGHCYCLECISKHFDNNKMFCPTCRKAATMACMKPAQLCCEIIQQYKNLRAELLTIIKNEHTSCSTSNLENVNNDLIFKSSDNRKPSRRIVPMAFHKQSKEKIKKALDKLCDGYNVKLRTDGDNDALIRRHKEFVHLYNAQIDLNDKDSLSVVDVIKEINRREEARIAGIKSMKKTAVIIEQLKNGEEPSPAKLQFKELIKQVRRNKQKQNKHSLESKSDDKSAEGDEDINGVSDSDSQVANNNADEHSTQDLSQGDPTKAASKDAKVDGPLVSRDRYIRDEISSLEKGEKMICSGEWRIIMSTKMQRPFFYNTFTEIGQFSIPHSFKDAFRDDGSLLISYEELYMQTRDSGLEPQTDLLQRKTCFSKAIQVEMGTQIDTQRGMQGDKSPPTAATTRFVTLNQTVGNSFEAITEAQHDQTTLMAMPVTSVDGMSGADEVAGEETVLTYVPPDSWSETQSSGLSQMPLPPIQHYRRGLTRHLVGSSENITATATSSQLIDACRDDNTNTPPMRTTASNFEVCTSTFVDDVDDVEADKLYYVDSVSDDHLVGSIQDVAQFGHAIDESSVMDMTACDLEECNETFIENSQEALITTWICVVCTFANDDAAVRCEMCDYFKESVEGNEDESSLHSLGKRKQAGSSSNDSLGQRYRQNTANASMISQGNGPVDAFTLMAVATKASENTNKSIVKSSKKRRR